MNGLSSPIYPSEGTFKGSVWNRTTEGLTFRKVPNKPPRKLRTSKEPFMSVQLIGLLAQEHLTAFRRLCKTTKLSLGPLDGKSFQAVLYTFIPYLSSSVLRKSTGCTLNLWICPADSFMRLEECIVRNRFSCFLFPSSFPGPWCSSINAIKDGILSVVRLPPPMDC